MFNFLTRVFGSSNERIIKKLKSTIDGINALEEKLSQMTDDELKARTEDCKRLIAGGTPLNELLVPAFATVREASKRTLGLRHFDVQMIGGIILHEGKIAEMLTGEGKTLVATLPVYLNALTGKGVHVVTVNDYLAKRDAEWMGAIYRFLGLSVGCIVPHMDDQSRQQAYAADITYGTNNEFGFDYLRDNMKFRTDAMVQRPFSYAIVDEVDSILIDEARTPLIISGPAEDSSEYYVKADRIIPLLKAEDFEIDEKQKNVTLTDRGQEHVEELMQAHGILTEGGMYDLQNIALVHHINQALRAHKLFQKDRDYIVKDNKVIIIDEFTGRMMDGRRYSEGLHQALEAKERTAIQVENQTLASITFQNYFRMYPKLAGMTGTAQTEAAEFEEIYGLQVVSIPPNVKVQRQDYQDEIYRTEKEKYEAIVQLIEVCQLRHQPVLVGTVSIEKSEKLSAILKKKKIAHQVLNARYHEQEAYIIGQAGRPGSVTIATNMAGRGTDIKLGGNLDMLAAEMLDGTKDEKKRQDVLAKIRQQVETDKAKVMAAGGLYVIGTERHESRRIDNQLRGRSGRQGDPGASKFFLSLDDDLMRIFASEKLQTFIGRLGLPEGEPISHPWVTRALEKAQQKVEARNFEIRKQLLKFDDVMNEQRKVVYQQRKELIAAQTVEEMITGMRHDAINSLVARAIPAESYPEQWDADVLHEEAMRLLALDLPAKAWFAEEGVGQEEILKRVLMLSDNHQRQKEKLYGAEVMRVAEKSIMLQLLDQHWKDHLLSLDHLRQGISLRAYAQKDPLNEYKMEAFGLFQGMIERLREGVTHLVSHVEPRVIDDLSPAPRKPSRLTEGRGDPALNKTADDAKKTTVVKRRSAAGIPIQIDPSDPSTWGRVRRNDACPCGSGKKYKHCHGQES